MTFLRQYEVIIEKDEQDYLDLSSPREPVSKTRITSFSKNQVQGQFRFSSISTAASADAHVLRIFNAEEDVKKALRQSGVRVIVKAGYRYDDDGDKDELSDLPIIFKGEVIKTKNYRNNTDTITEVTMSSALTNKRVAKVSKSFPKGTNVKTILDELAKTLGLEVSIDLGAKNNLTLSNGRSYNGNTVQVLERETNRLGCTWYIQNEKIYIVNKDELSKVVDYGVVYKVDSGRIKGSINWSTEGSTSDATSQGKIKSDFTMFLVPTLLVGDKIEIELEGSLTTLTVDALEHSIDFYGDTWDTKVTATSEAGV